VARLVTAGAETGDAAAEGGGSSFLTTAAAARTGTAGYRVGSALVSGPSYPVAYVLGRTYYHRFYFRKNTDPSAEQQLCSNGQSNGFVIRLQTSGVLRLMVNAGATIADSAVLNNDQWYRVEYSTTINSGSADDSAELLIDGVSAGSGSSLTAATGVGTQWNITTDDVGTAVDLDDIGINDDQGADQNTWPGAGSVVLCKPISDSQDGSWTGGAGGTGIDLSLAVSSTPPVGTAAETNTTQIESVDSSGNNATDEYRANLTTYTDAGIGASDTINVLQAIINHGEDVNTGTKTGSFGLQSNPSQTYGTFTFGDNVGALGTFPTNWRSSFGPAAYSPSPTRGSSPVLAVRKTDTGTRVASVDFMGLYVEYVPADFDPKFDLGMLNVQPPLIADYDRG